MNHRKADLMGAHSTGLWDYALSLYAQPAPQGLPYDQEDGAGPTDVMSACLLLQDEAGLDVCELLWIHWLAARGVALGASPCLLLGEVRDWQRGMTVTLRERRRQLKQHLTEPTDTRSAATTRRLETLYQQLKACELSAEQEALARLEALSPPAHAPTPPFMSCHDPRRAFLQSLRQLTGQVALDEGDDSIVRALHLLATSRAGRSSSQP